MPQNRNTITLKIDGMTCVNCENKIERKLSGTEGITDVKVSYNDGTAEITFDSTIIEIKDIEKIIEKLDYKVVTQRAYGGNKNNISNILGIVVVIFALYMLMSRFGLFNIFNLFPVAKEDMGYGMLFFIGLLTSVHCIAMCGGINLSQCIPHGQDEKAGKLANLRPSFLYNLGRVISYTIIGGIIGAIGKGISFSGSASGFVQLAAGIFMVIMGLNMLNAFPWLRKLNPRMPKIFAQKINTQKLKGNSPLIVGLLNGLMPCGPLQAMQLYALSTEDPIKGALSMLIFSLGTVPLMFGFGAISSILSKKFTSKIMTAGAVLVVILGISMFNSGMALSGFSNLLIFNGSLDSSAAEIDDGIQVVTTNLNSGRYQPITVQVGVPVKWTITAAKGTINGCNNRMFIPEYNIEKKLEVGDNVIEFTPTRTGTFPYSCWMGMIRSSITVVEEEVDTSANSNSLGSPENSSDQNQFKEIYQIPTDDVLAAEIRDGKQYAKIEMDDAGFSPAVVVVQSGLETELTINAKTINISNSSLIFAAYSAQLNMVEGENTVRFLPESDFDISAADGSFFGYIKVVEDLNNIDMDSIKREVSEYIPIVQDFNSGGGGSCCN